MKISQPILIALLIAIAFTLSCKQNGALNSLDTSFNSWKSYKASVNNSYAYNYTKSLSTGISTITTITVQNGKVTQRDFLEYKYAVPPTSKIAFKDTLTAWHETAADLSTHTGALPLYTLDDIYDLAKNTWLKVSTANNNVYFEAKNNGLISTAGYVTKNCEDDCFIGVNISNIKP